MWALFLSVVCFICLSVGQTAEYKYLGCVVDTGNRIFKGFNQVVAKMTPKLCIQVCKERDLRYAGVQYGNQCYCDNFKPSTFVSESDCNAKCNGDKTLMCGGTWRMGVYDTGAPASLPYTYVGCVKDKGERLLNGFNKNFPKRLTHRACADECKARQFRYAGVQFGNQCYCGNNKPSTSSSVDESECNMKCAGNTLQMCGGSWKMGVFDTEEPDVFYKLMEQSGCGQSNLNSVVHEAVIINSKPTEYGNFPWHAALYHRKQVDPSTNQSVNQHRWDYVCGGTLITPSSVLTAAHCVTGESYGVQAPVLEVRDVMVALGKNNRSWESEEVTAVHRAVKQIHVPSNYWGGTTLFGEDIAVVVLQADVPVSNSIMPACIDRNNNYTHRLTAGLSGLVAGWGHTELCGRGSVCSNPDMLQYTNTSILDYNACMDAMQKKHRGVNMRLTTDKLCSGDGSVSVIQKGDSGSGLVFDIGMSYYLYGVVSTKAEIQGRYSFGTFTNVTHYLDWILTKVQ